MDESDRISSGKLAVIVSAQKDTSDKKNNASLLHTLLQGNGNKSEVNNAMNFVDDFKPADKEFEDEL